MATELEVFLCRRRVGHLVETSGGAWSFMYTRDALADNESGPVSVALPRLRERHHGDDVYAVFANLLPDGSLRSRLTQSFGLSEGNDFALLERLGRECAGGLSLRPPGGHWHLELPQRPLDDAELRNVVAVLPVHPLLAEADGVSKTLSGEFDKLPVRVSDRRVSVVIGDEATTHIIKPAKPGLRESVLNEAYCMALADAWGLPTAPVQVLHGRASVLAVERIDRRPGPTFETVHMEDFCQVLGHPPSRKYEREGGPRLVEIATVLRRTSTSPALDLRVLVRFSIFSFIVGFGAAHAKQLALIHGPRGPRLGALFGLWSTHVYPEMNFRMGFAIGHEDRPDWLTTQRWREFAAEIGVRPAFVVDQIKAAAGAVPALARQIADEFRRSNGHAEIIRPVRALIEQRCRQLLVSLESEQGASPTPRIHA